MTIYLQTTFDAVITVVEIIFNLAGFVKVGRAKFRLKLETTEYTYVVRENICNHVSPYGGVNHVIFLFVLALLRLGSLR